MKVSKLNEKELIKLMSILLGSFQKEILDKEFPIFMQYAKEVNQDLINEVVTEEALKIQTSDSVTLSKSDFISLYAHLSALLGSKETNIRYGGLRLLLLNTCTQEELNSTLMLIDQIKKTHLTF